MGRPRCLLLRLRRPGRKEVTWKCEVRNNQGFCLGHFKFKKSITDPDEGTPTGEISPSDKSSGTISI